MANIRAPEYGVKKDELTLTTQDPAAVMYGVTPDNKWVPVKVGDDGSLIIGSTVTLEMSDIEIGAVELKNYNTDDRIYVSPAHEALTQARLYDAAGLALTSSTIGLKQALDINVVGGTAISASEAEDDSVPAGMNLAAVITLGYGYDGIDWQRLHSASNRLLVDGSQVTQPISAASLPLPTGAATEATLLTRATEVTLSGLRTDFNAVDFSTETTLLAVKTDLDKFTFLGGSVNSNITNATLAVTQSGVWSTGRTWTLASGTDSVDAVQSGNWSVRLQDGSGNAISSTSNALDVNIKSGVTLEVNLDNANDDVLIYGNDGSTNRAIKTDIAGDVLTDPIDKTTRELGRVLASDSVIPSETVSTSSNVYSTARPVNGDMNVRHYKTKKIYVKNTSAFNGRMQIFGSIDDGANFDVTIVPDQALNAGVTSITDLTDAVTHLQIQIRSQNNGQTTTFVSKAYALGV